ncbi:hypothetical protein [Rhodococcus sovatensis]|uniref:PH domain-containing protein n=1 Tax=Rhodococcus sovatensis TaxID=1805840 RepID=A0ABZ2PR41_9NOCA
MTFKSFHRSMQVLAATVLVVDAFLLATGFLRPGQAVLLFAAVELPLAMIVAFGLVATYRARRRDGADARAAVVATAGDSPFWPMIRAEARAYTSLWLWVRGRVADVEPGALVFRSNRGTMTLPVAFGVATVVEIGVLHFVLPWMWLRIALAVLSVWSLFALLGYLAIHRVRPHYSTDTHFVVRQSGSTIAAIERSTIESVVLSRRYSETNPIAIADRLHLPNIDGTNVDIVLAQPISIQLPVLLHKHRKATSIRHISVYVDDPAALVTELQGGATPVARR